MMKFKKRRIRKLKCKLTFEIMLKRFKQRELKSKMTRNNSDWPKWKYIFHLQEENALENKSLNKKK